MYKTLNENLLEQLRTIVAFCELKPQIQLSTNEIELAGLSADKPSSRQGYRRTDNHAASSFLASDSFVARQEVVAPIDEGPSRRAHVHSLLRWPLLHLGPDWTRHHFPLPWIGEH